VEVYGFLRNLSAIIVEIIIINDAASIIKTVCRNTSCYKNIKIGTLTKIR